MIEYTFGSLVCSCWFAYLDKILVFSLSAEQHKQELKKVFETINSWKFHIKTSKYELFNSKILFLGKIIFENRQVAC